MTGSKTNTARPLDTLRAVLATAHGLLDEIANDPLLVRVLHALATIPEADRETIVRVLERDAAWTRIVAATAETTGISVRPNPHASLYVHVFDPATGLPIEPEPSARDVSVMLVGLERFARIFPLLFQEGVHAQWSPAALAVARAVDGDVRAAAARLAREVLVVVAQVEAEAKGEPTS